jgi:alanyl-tRNA synthetase
MRDAADVFSVPVEKLPESANRFFTEWKAQRKTIDELRDEIAVMRRRELLGRATMIGEARVVRATVPAGELEAVANQVKQESKTVALLGAVADGRVRLLVARSQDLERVHAGKIVKVAAAVVGGSGGGKAEAAQGGGTDPDRLDEALAAAEEAVRKMLGA